MDGKTILNGSGVPSGGTGADGDFYIDTTADAIYGPKTAGAWGSATALGNRYGAIILTLSGNGSVLTTGLKYGVQIPYAGTITGWTLVGEDASGSIVLDLWKDSYANFPPVVGDSITASAKPTISAARKATSSTLTGWTTSFAAGDWVYVNVDSVSTFKWVQLILSTTKT